jgi:hypothetical protein
MPSRIDETLAPFPDDVPVADIYEVSKIDEQKGNSNHVVAAWCLALELALLSISVLV